jgi:hypothetical protein
MLHTRSLTGTIELDGCEYRWDLRREPQWCTVDGFQGMLIGVRREDGDREALIQFPRPQWKVRRSTPHRQRPQVQRAQLEEAIRAALAAGWEPETRGKPFHVQL